MERGESRGPAVIANQYGKGRAIYVNGSLENFYTCERVASTQRMLASMVRYLGGNAPLPFELSAPAGVYGVLRRTISGDVALWVLAPVGFKDEAAGRMRQQFLPVENVEIRILVPEQRQVKAVRLLRAGRNVPFNLSGPYVVVTIPVLHIAELVHVGRPLVEGATVTGTVEAEGLGDKVLVFKYKAKKQYRRTRGHRQAYSKVHIDKIRVAAETA